MYEVTETGTACTGPAYVQSTQTPLRKGSRNKALLSKKMIFLIKTYWERENWLFSVECLWLYKLHSRVGHVPRSIWETQNRLHHVWVVYFVSFCFIWAIWAFSFYLGRFICCLVYIFIFILFLRDRKRKRGGRLSRETVRGRDGETQKKGEKKRENKVM